MNLKKLNTNQKYQKKMLEKYPYLIDKVDKVFNSTNIDVNIINRYNFRKLSFKHLKKIYIYNPFILEQIVSELTPSEIIQLLKLDSNGIKYIPLNLRKQSYYKLAIKRNTINDANFDINDLCHENKVLLLQKEPHRIQYLKKQKQKYCWVALKSTRFRKITILSLIRNPSLSMCDYVAHRVNLTKSDFLCMPKKIAKILKNRVKIETY